jgi:hypothetical protein
MSMLAGVKMRYSLIQTAIWIVYRVASSKKQENDEKHHKDVKKIKSIDEFRSSMLFIPT